MESETATNMISWGPYVSKTTGKGVPRFDYRVAETEY